MKSSKKVVDTINNVHIKKRIDKTDIAFFCNDHDNESSKFWELDIAKTKLSKILNSSLDVICAVDVKGNFLYVSAACESVWGYRADELIGKPLMDFVCPEDHEKTKAEAAKVMEGNNRIHFENRYVRKDGSLVPITWSARWDEKDKIRYGVARDASEKKRGETILLESENINKSLFTNSPFPIYIWDIETSRLIDCNKETLLKYNYSREEFLQLSINDLSTAKDFKLIDEQIKVEGNGGIHKRAWQHKKKNGELLYIDVCGHLINYNGREAFLVMANDVTKRIEAEELKEFDKINTDALINSTEDLIWSVNFNFELIVANKAFIQRIEDITGITLVPGNDLLMTKIFQEEQLDFWKECYSYALLGQPLKKEVYSKATKNWAASWADISFNPIYKDETVVGVACYSKDITKRKLAEEQLRKSEARLIEAQGVAKIGSWETDLLTLEIIWSEETYRIFEVNPDLFQSSHPDFINYVHPDDREKVDAAFAASFSCNTVNIIEHRIITPGGLEKTVEECWRIFCDEGGEPVRAMGTCRDITERKKSEEVIKKAYEEKNAVLERIDDGFFAVNKDSLVTYWNKRAEILLEAKKEEMLGKNLHEMFATAGPNTFYENYQKALRENTTVHFEEFSQRANKWFSVSAYASDDGLSVYFKDVTERKNAEEKIRESEFRYRSLIEQATDAICITDTSMRIKDINFSGCQMLGYSKEEFLQLSLADLFSQEDLITNPFKIDELQSGKIIRTERRLRKNDGTLIEVEMSSKLLEDGRIIVFGHDITDRKKAEESNRFKAELLNTIGQATIASDINGKINFWNKAAEEIYGWTEAEAIGRKIIELIPAKQTKEQATDIMNKLSQGFSWSGEFMVKRKNGQVFPAFVTNSPIYDEHNKLTGIIGVSTDITERKQSEQKLKESNERFNLVSKATNDMVWDWNILTGEVYRNKEGWRKILGDCENEIENGTIDDWDNRIHPEDAEKVRLTIREIQEVKKDFFEIECRMQRYDGTYAYIHDKGNIIRDEEGNAVRILGATQDITKRKEAELQVAKSELRFKSLVQNSSDLISILDDSAYYTYSSPAVKKILGYEPEYMIGKNAFSFIHPDDIIKIKEHFINRNTTSYMELTPYRYRNAKGEWRWLESKITDMRNNEEVQGFVFNSRDVTERKIAEEEIEKLSIIAKETVNAVIITDPDEKILWVNEAFTRITEYEPAEVMGKRPGDFLQGDETNQAVVRFMRQKIKNTEPFECDILNYSKSGQKYWLRIQCQPQYDEAGKLKYFFAIETDITKEKEAEQILKASEERYRYLFDNNPSGIMIWNPDDLQILEVNESCQKMYGYGRKEFLKLNLLDLRLPEEHHKINELARQLQSNDTLKPVGLWKHVDSAGNLMYMHIASHQIYYQGRKVIMAISNNVTQKILLEEEFENQKTIKQKEITEAVISAQEQERQEIGRELHDNINQILASSRLYLSMVEKGSEKNTSFWEETDNLINTAINEIRSLSHSMIPPSLNESELMEALSHLIEKTSRPGGIAFNLVSDNFDESNITDKHKLTIYRIVQEQFNNILKYASAKNVIVELNQHNEKIMLSIKDDGVGFDTENKSKGVGLMNIKTRASLFNGEMIIVSSPGNGCELRVVFN